MSTKREKLPQHFTVSAIVFCHDHILLVDHKRIGAWLPPGGHIEPFEMPHEAAIREVLEETGVQIEIVTPLVPQTNDLEAFFLPQPICLHSVCAIENNQKLFHIDLVYLGKTNGNDYLPPIKHSPEVKKANWVALSDLDKLNLAKNVKEAVKIALAYSDK